MKKIICFLIESEPKVRYNGDMKGEQKMAELLTAATLISYYLVAVNIIAFILYGTDKAKAMHHQWRIKEAVLIGIAFVGGAFGAFAGMIVFHHKTRKMKFRILVPIAIIIWLTLGGFWQNVMW